MCHLFNLTVSLLQSIAGIFKCKIDVQLCIGVTHCVAHSYSMASSSSEITEYSVQHLHSHSFRGVGCITYYLSYLTLPTSYLTLSSVE